ncbi:Uma2 family endonuclease [Aphanizomenon flos-aquae NRERC-008]|uniref:Uma2 family endonuclease n=1 Tax=Aphanizomenon flos-aquae FACHB-1249 TaxID=2692889 RepID=A0ABR8ISJ3_APHFL|nr:MULTISPECIES: Uma2 family endonuclease [Aphanizomenon]MBD2389756.1 Uma2 family endonuclease [Aphanizomenon flos-aquae FACHB-1171]MBD2556945.1 Uma2 family endonuclease [Aphanizomenon flos-aquae FACHB-1290]MBD2631295.1 Uma2 family endonuclease [Aphanizomenon sp. FACHB-1399]MBD2642995.1 Uma2 family endonuclease [Aphanizomenon sp. FACHB-1401]MBD2655989.1 Uma2 family endonuclease [Aphanizomenon flos-aquae FACHB-1265]
MVAIKDKFPKLTPEEYFLWEEKQLLRHEYLNGELYAMSGGTQNHGRIASNIIFIVKGHLRGGGCQVGNSDCRVNILETKDYVYPDVSVTCDERDRTAIEAIQYPCLIVEVLSPSTASYDRGDKFRLYRRNPSLQDYVLVDAEKIAIDLYRKNDIGNWEIFNYQSGDNIELRSIDLSFPIESVYEDIVFEELG